MERTRNFLSTAKSTIVFVNSKNRFPMAAPDFVEKALKQKFNPIEA